MNKMLLQEYIEQVLAEAISEDSTYKNKIKSLFNQWINKFSTSYINHRKIIYPRAWTIKEILYAEDFQQQHIKLLFDEVHYSSDALVFEHEGSIFVGSHKATCATFTGGLILPIGGISEWQWENYLFKLSISDFVIAMDVADTYVEFIALCSSMNVKHEQ